jgi:DNA-binding beta-propeller fold protein YncE
VRLQVAISALLCFGLFLPLSSCAGLGGPGAVEGEVGYVLFPPSPQEPRIQFLAAYSSDANVLPPLSGFRRFVLGDREAREIGKPYGVAIHDGKILVCDTMARIVVVFDLKAQKVGLLGAGPNGRLRKPVNIEVDDDGTRYVVDVDLQRVMVYDGNDRYLRALGDPEAWSPTDVAISGKRLYVTDKKSGQVVLLEKATGEELKRFSRLGSGKGELFAPTNIVVGADGSVYVSDTGNFRILKFDSRGKLLQQIGSLGRGLGQFVRPKGVAVDREGRVYVADAAIQNVQIFEPEGKLLLFFGGAGAQPGRLSLPAKVAIDYDNVELFADRVVPGYEIEYLIAVTSQFGPNKVTVFGFLVPSKRGKN